MRVIGKELELSLLCDNISIPECRVDPLMFDSKVQNTKEDSVKRTLVPRQLLKEDLREGNNHKS